MNYKKKKKKIIFIYKCSTTSIECLTELRLLSSLSSLHSSAGQFYCCAHDHCTQSVHFALSEISDDVIALRVRRVPRRGGQRHLGVFGQEWEVGGEIETLELGAAEAVDQRVHQAVHVGEDHEAVKDHRGLVLGGRAGLLHPGDQQHHPGEGAGQEADGEDHHDRGHQEDGSPQLRLVAHRLLPEPVDDSRGAVDHDDEGDHDLAEEDRLSQAVHHVLQSEKHTVVSGQVYKLSISMGLSSVGRQKQILDILQPFKPLHCCKLFPSPAIIVV